MGRIVAPRGVTPAITERLRRSVAIAASDEEVKSKLINVGIVATSSTPAELVSFIKAEIEKWSAVVKEGGFQFAN